jgi:hypothetical protein
VADQQPWADLLHLRTLRKQGEAMTTLAVQLFKAGDRVVLNGLSREMEIEAQSRFGNRRTFTVNKSMEISGGLVLWLEDIGGCFWADYFDIIDDDPLGAK